MPGWLIALNVAALCGLVLWKVLRARPVDYFERLSERLPFGMAIYRMGPGALAKDHAIRLVHLNHQAVSNLHLVNPDFVPPEGSISVTRLDRLTGTNAERAAHRNANLRDVYVKQVPLVMRDDTFAGQTWRTFYQPLGGRYVALIYVEISDLTSALERQLQANRDLEQFAYISSHDLKEPLRGVQMCLGAVRDIRPELFDDPEIGEYLRDADGAASHGTEIVDDLLRFSRIRPDNMEVSSVDLADVFERTCDELGHRLREVDAEVVVQSGMPTIPGDPKFLQRMVANVFSNSLKFRSPDKPLRIEVSAFFDATSVHVAIRDNGIGIEPEYQDEVFGVFKRLYSREEYPGTGIGLALVKRVAHVHRGEVTIESAGVGEGTTIHLVLPVRATTPPGSAATLSLEPS